MKQDVFFQDFKERSFAEVVDHLKYLSVEGRSVDYKDEIHIPIMIDIIARGDSVAGFCSQAYISKEIFYDWLEKYPKFLEAYKKALAIGENYVTGLPLRRPDINMKYWELIMKNQYGFGNKYIGAMKEISITKRLEALRTLLADADISLDEYTNMLNSSVVELKSKALMETLSIENKTEVETLTKKQTYERANALIKSLGG